MVKLTAEIIQNSMQYINPVKDRELDLRGMDTSSKRGYHSNFVSI